jgi:crotonobetaine/carnitine-CoA ligase
VPRLDLGCALTGDADAPGLEAEHPMPAPEDTCLVFFTSGTTGVPKGVMHAHRTFVVAGEGFVERQWIQPDDRMLCILPMFHVNALFYSLGGALAAGATLVLGGRFSASRFWPLVASSGATQVNMLGSIGKILALRPRAEFVPDHRLDRVYCVPMPTDVQQVFRETFGVRWIAEGMPYTQPNEPVLNTIAVEPSRISLKPKTVKLLSINLKRGGSMLFFSTSTCRGGWASISWRACRSGPAWCL